MFTNLLSVVEPANFVDIFFSPLRKIWLNGLMSGIIF